MNFIHELPGWPGLRWDASALGGPLAELRHRQGLLLGRMASLGLAGRTEATLATLTNEVVSSSAIEGERLPPEIVRSSIARRLGLETGGLRRGPRDVEGVVEMMLDATRRYQDPLTRSRLFAWHAALFPTGRSGLRKIRVGAWRPPAAGAMQVVSGPVGRERVHFEAPAAARLPSEMKRLLDWIGRKTNLDPVLRAGVAHFWFVTLHPFEDGNGRIGRAIAELLLARADRSPERFYSLSSAIAAERDGYYHALESGQRGGLDITSWLGWFLACLDRAIARAETELAAVLRKEELLRRLDASNPPPARERQRRVVERLLGRFEGPLTTSKYARLAGCSTDTALRDIQALEERGVLARNPAGGRSTSYRLAGNENAPPRPSPD